MLLLSFPKSRYQKHDKTKPHSFFNKETGHRMPLGFPSKIGQARQAPQVLVWQRLKFGYRANNLDDICKIRKTVQ